MDIKKVGVAGIGTMGSGIAIVTARAGYETIVLDKDEAVLTNGQARIERFFSSSVEKGKMTEERKKAALSGLRTTTCAEDLRECSIVIEAVFEDVNIKKRLFSELGTICPKETLFLTNTSTLSVTSIASGSPRPERVVGMHFCNPAPLMRLVEVSKALQTSEASYREAMEFAGILGKIAVTTRDTPGFIVNLFLIPFTNDCLRLLESGAAGTGDIDTAVRLGLGYPMGPFQLLDIVGLELFESVSLSMYSQFKDPRYATPPLDRRMIDAGWLGMKAGKGFYEYREKGMFGATSGGQGPAAGGRPAAESGIKKVGVIGAGTMGSGIAQVCAQKGMAVTVYEPKAALVKKGIGRISNFLSEGVKRGKVTEEEKKAVLKRIGGATRFADLRACDMIIEAVFEDMALKKKIFAQADKVAGPGAILATNTSCLSVTEIASATKRPDRVLGLHFFNPVPLMKLVEVVRGLETSDEVFSSGMSFAASLNKMPVACTDSPGFIVNRVLCPYLNQVVQAYNDGLASKEDIDTACELGLGYPMGPLKLLDLIGLDVHLFIAEAMFKVLNEKKYAPPPLLRKMVLAGRLGRKTGHGFYDYKKP